MTERIIRNAAKCKLCHDEIESLTRHDFQTCTCGEIFVDGGLSYLRGGAKHTGNFLDRSETIYVGDSDHEHDDRIL